MNQCDFHANLTYAPICQLCLVQPASGEHAVAEQAVPLPYTSLTFVFQPPFVMEKWIVGITENQTVECTVTYEVSLGWGVCAGGEGGRVEGLVAFSVGIYLDEKPLNQCE